MANGGAEAEAAAAAAAAEASTEKHVVDVNVDDVVSLAGDLLSMVDTSTDKRIFGQLVNEIQLLTRSIDSHKSHLQSSLKGIQDKALICEQNVKVAEQEGVDDVSLEELHGKLLEEQKNERLLKEEIRMINEEMSNLELKRADIEKRKGSLRNIKEQEIRAQNTVSLYASMTKMLPEINSVGKHAGYYVDKEKKIVKRFSLDPCGMPKFSLCNQLWNMQEAI